MDFQSTQLLEKHHEFPPYVRKIELKPKPLVDGDLLT